MTFLRGVFFCDSFKGWRDEIPTRRPGIKRSLCGLNPYRVVLIYMFLCDHFGPFMSEYVPAIQGHFESPVVF